MEIRVSPTLASFERHRRWTRVTPASPSGNASRRRCELPRTQVFGFCRRWSLESPRLSHPFSASGGFQVPGFPRTLFRPLRLSMHPLGSPPVYAPSGLAGDRTSSRPEVRILSATDASATSMPRNCALPSDACRCIRRLSRSLHLPAVPATDLRVTPNLSPFGASVACVPGCPRTPSVPAAPPDEATGRPARFIFRLGLGVRVSGLPRLLAPLAPADGSPSFPGSRTFRLCRPCVFGFPRILHLRLGQMMTPVLLELCILSSAADESSFQSGFAHSRLTLDAFSQSHSCLPLIGKPTGELPTSTASCTVPSNWNCVSNSLLAHQLERSLGLLNLWKQV